jgi:hypothetical protein
MTQSLLIIHMVDAALTALVCSMQERERKHTLLTLKYIKDYYKTSHLLNILYVQLRVQVYKKSKKGDKFLLSLKLFPSLAPPPPPFHIRHPWATNLSLS